MGEALLITGTTSDAGKSLVVAGLCRLLARRGVRVAPFKGQNMANNSAVTASGAEIGRAQAMQAFAANLAPEAVMNPVLLKPNSDTTSQVVVMGEPLQDTNARDYGDLIPRLRPIVLDALNTLRADYDVVICEGAGSPAEINLRERDLVNFGLAEMADLPVWCVGDIERGGVFASLYGTWAIVSEADRERLTGFIINNFRGDPTLLDPGIRALTAQTQVPVFGVIPHLNGLLIDAEDSLGITNKDGGPPISQDGLVIAAVRFPRISNFTDLDAIAAMPGVSVVFTTNPALIRAADLAVLPGTKATQADLAWLRAQGLADALLARAESGDPILGICGGLQMLGQWIEDPDAIEGGGTSEGLQLLPIHTTFEPTKLVRQVAGYNDVFNLPGSGYEIRHGRIHPDNDRPMWRNDHIFGTGWHGFLDDDATRAAFLSEVAAIRGLDFTPGAYNHDTARLASLDRVADAFEEYLDLSALPFR
ncbi:cobyric acid synthase [Stomatohabitans albus]|uniref:cobyric acid synthase n=1 Tax=Stomatohabitans albus TaxID=3110766 RepID=UPI00300C085E